MTDILQKAAIYAGWLEITDDALIAFDDDQVILAASPALLDMAGFDDRSQLVGSHMQAIIGVHSPTHAKPFPDNDTRGPRNAVPLRRRDGSKVMVSVEGRTVPMPRGGNVRIGVVTPA